MSWESINTRMGVQFPLLQLLSDTLQAAIPSRASIFAFRIILSPALERGGSTEREPSGFIFVCIKIFIGCIMGRFSPRLRLILSRQFGCPSPL